MLADEETVEMHATGGQSGPVGGMLLGSDVALRDVELDVMDETNAPAYWQRSDRFEWVLDIGFTRPGLDALCRVLEIWVRHLTATEVRIQPVQKISDERWTWHVGLDVEASRLLNDLYERREVGEARLAVFARTTRCEATNVDPESGARDMAVPELLARTWGHSDFGVYAKVADGGEIVIGGIIGKRTHAAPLGLVVDLS